VTIRSGFSVQLAATSLLCHQPSSVNSSKERSLQGMPALPVLCPWRMKMARIQVCSSSYIPGMIGCLRFGLRASGQGHAVPLPSGAKGSLDAELVETILAASGMEASEGRILGLLEGFVGVWTMVSLPWPLLWPWRWLFARLPRVSIVSPNPQTDRNPSLGKSLLLLLRGFGAAAPWEMGREALGPCPKDVLRFVGFQGFHCDNNLLLTCIHLKQLASL